MSYYTDIYRMHEQHQLPIGTRPRLLNDSDQRFRESFLREELLEFELAWQNGDLAEAADGLVDLVVVALGTAVMMGLPFDACWAEVLRANLAKERVRSERANGSFDLAKPEGWEPPNLVTILDEFQDHVPPPTPRRRPKIICLCGSTRFKTEYEEANARLTMKGYIVLSVGMFGHADGIELSATEKARLDTLHLQKIDLADGILVIDPGGYIGDSTRGEIAYAKSLGKEVRYLSEGT